MFYQKVGVFVYEFKSREIFLSALNKFYIIITVFSYVACLRKLCTLFDIDIFKKLNMTYFQLHHHIHFMLQHILAKNNILQSFLSN